MAAKENQAKMEADRLTPEEVRRRAFEIYERRNGGDGDPLSDWLQAERELIDSGREHSGRVEIETKPERRVHA
ncbi:MAG: DUF2934 domain-containing protein [Phycisphaerales bacterium JB037]